ncbi:MAG: hypothetical protein IJQ34_03745 [Kiritimatiellae bacterium]|nr:hypothetical protein [Kiritimatiellia bacterium]
MKISLKTIIPLAIAATLSLATGCATVKYSSPAALKDFNIKGTEPGPGKELVVIDTSGFYILWCLPIASGDLRWNENKKSIEGGISWFDDLCGVKELQDALLKIAESRNCDLADVTYFDSDTIYAGPSYEGAVGIFFGSSRLSASAVLVPRKNENKEASL